MVSEDDKIVEGCYGVSPRRRAGTEGGFPSLFRRGGGHGQGMFKALGLPTPQ
jgi:hypothetical protein